MKRYEPRGRRSPGGSPGRARSSSWRQGWRAGGRPCVRSDAPTIGPDLVNRRAEARDLVLRVEVVNRCADHRLEAPRLEVESRVLGSRDIDVDRPRVQPAGEEFGGGTGGRGGEHPTHPPAPTVR